MLLSVRDLKTSFQTPHGPYPAVDGISFDIARGSTLCIIGESGSGKSVTALSILRLIQEPAGKIEAGQVLFNGNNLMSLSKEQMRSVRGRQISMIFQEPMTSLNPVFTVGDQIIETLRLHKRLNYEEAKKRCIETMLLVGIPDAAERISFYPHQLSGGLRQRIMIAMALACEPDLLIADEPTTALDVTIQSQILKLLKDLQDRLGMAILLITHDFGVVAEMAEEVAVMYAGKIVESGSVQKIFDSPKHPYTRALQKAVPKLGHRNRKLYTIPFMVPSLPELAAGVDLEEKWALLEKDLLSTPDELQESKKVKPTDKPLLEINKLNVKYILGTTLLGKPKKVIHCVQDLDLKIFQGEIVGLVGESGCGKSTLGKSIVGLVKPFSGSIKYQDTELVGARSDVFKPLRQKIQMIFQDPFSSLNPRMKVGAIIEEALIIHGYRDRVERRKKVLSLLDIVGLRAESHKKYPHEFSGGQRQRIGIARALAVNPSFIVADEPVSALDVSIQAQVLNLLKDLKAQFSLTYLFISHDLNVVQYLCDRILVMLDGQLVDELTPSQVTDPNHPKHEYTQQLLAAIPRSQPPLVA